MLCNLSVFKKETERTIREKDSLLILPNCDKCYSKKGLNRILHQVIFKTVDIFKKEFFSRN